MPNPIKISVIILLFSFLILVFSSDYKSWRSGDTLINEFCIKTVFVKMRFRFEAPETLFSLKVISFSAGSLGAGKILMLLSSKSEEFSFIV